MPVITPPSISAVAATMTAVIAAESRLTPRALRMGWWRWWWRCSETWVVVLSCGLVAFIEALLFLDGTRQFGISGALLPSYGPPTPGAAVRAPRARAE